ncbi:hypothetical protein RR48_08777 [Papilio machaon]|uniref:Uncharacterized protein n=1 Tax=Papilio machaon TaxID=76193 RepID=A0A194RMR2_PAPMA|nr:hypothetical protein RR48_08777 [Papilio machaon]
MPSHVNVYTYGRCAVGVAVRWAQRWGCKAQSAIDAAYALTWQGLELHAIGISTERGERADCRVGSAPLPTSVHDATQPEHHCPQVTLHQHNSAQLTRCLNNILSVLWCVSQSIQVKQQQAPEAAAAAADVTGASAGPRPARYPAHPAPLAL